MKEAIRYFEDNNIVECSDCPKHYDYTCSGRNASRCNAYRKALKALKFIQEMCDTEPLNIEELKNCDGKPVWYVNQNGGHWEIASSAMWCDSSKNKNYGKTWVVYRCNPSFKIL